LPDARSLRAIGASANYFEVLGVRPVVGRTFNAADLESHAPVAVIAHSLWTAELDGNPAVIGRSIRIADRFVHIIGVAPPLFAGLDRDRAGVRRISGGRSPDIWLPLWLLDQVMPLPAAEERRQERELRFVGRLRNGVDLQQLQAEATVVATRLAAPATGSRAEVLRLRRVNPRYWHLGIMLVMPIPILVLAIACVNAANLMLARGSQRQREIAIRLAIGAGRGRIVRQLLFESALLALAASAAAVPFASWGVQLASGPFNIPIPIDATVLALTVLTAACTTVAFGLAPALRVSAQQPSTAFGPSGGRNDAAPPQTRMRRTLVVAQVALSLGLLATGSQLIATVRAQAVSAGTPPNRLLIARFDLQPLRMAPHDIDGFYRELASEAARLPGVEAVGLARHTSVWTFGRGAAPASVLVWRPSDAPDKGHVTIGGYASGELFDAVGLRVIAGRGFTDADRRQGPRVAIVNDTAAKTMNGPAIGSTLRVAPRTGNFNSSIEVRIVGVIEPATEPRLEQDEVPAPKIYLPVPLEAEPALALYLRTHDDATALARSVREVVGRIAPLVPLQEAGSLEELNEQSYALQLWLARAAAFLGVLGLLLATAGLYGISSYLVAMRSREIAIRVAVGARPQAILTMILNQSMRVASIGLLVGGAAAVAASRVIQSEYHGIQGINAAAFGGAVLLFITAMLVASAVPAFRAARVDPVENLKDA
jgi:predicted permease